MATAARPAPRPPTIARSVVLHFQGDWGTANLHKIAGWLAQEIELRTGPHSRVAIWNGRHGMDALRAAAWGDVDIAVTTPSSAARMAVEGTGFFEGEPYPYLRAIGNVPHDDHLTFAVSAKTGIASFADLRARKPPLRIAAQAETDSLIGYAVRRVMEGAGIPEADLRAWGGGYVVAERPLDCCNLVKSGEADALFTEAIMTPYWNDLAETRELNFIPIEAKVAAEMGRRFGWGPTRVPAGYLRGIREPLDCVDFTGFLVVARDDLPDDIAYLLAWSMVETRSVLEGLYRHVPPRNSPVSYPIRPEIVASSPIPLHPGAARAYRDLGLVAE